MTEPQQEQQAVTRTPAPSDWEQGIILMQRNLMKDCKKPHIWFARLLGGPLLWMLYTLGFLFADGETSANSFLSAGVRFFDPEPIIGTGIEQQKIILAGNTSQTILDAVEQQLASTWGRTVVTVSSETKPASFYDFCATELGETHPETEICVFVQEELAYDIYFGGDEFVQPFDEVLVGAQYAVQASLLAANGFVAAGGGANDTDAASINATTSYVVVDNVQKVPELDAELGNGAAPVFALIFPGVMLVLSCAIMMQFIMAPLSTEKFKEVIRSFVLVGVKLRVYLHQWLAYLALSALATAAAYTAVSFAWNIFSASSAGLVFLSHYMALVHLISVAVMLTQLSNQEELTQGLPWLMAIGSAAVSIAFILLEGSGSSIGLSIFAVLSPFVGMFQYCAIYSDYDLQGFETGIRAGENVVSSGLLGSLLAQAVGIAVWNAAILWWAAPKPVKLRAGDNLDNEATSERPADKFESLPPNADVLLRVSGLSHTYQSPFCKKAKPVEVLKGLDLDICRGEVFGYLGHNASGKTTSIGILSGELGLQEGSVTYHFNNGDKSIAKTEELAQIHKNIGICPQHNDSLHEDVSCRDFLRLFARLKGRTPQRLGQSKAEAIEEEVERRLAEIKFTSPEDADKLIESYSGGMKRKVCIALAFLADPEVVFLDEPSAGIDPYNRRQIWDMISSAKEGRSIILTTHFLDEADVLSDRVGILKDGRLVSCGSTLFLKHQIGGYSLRFNNAHSVDISAFVDGASPVDRAAENSYEWALKHGTEESFPSALRELEKCGATNVSLELTSLEHVFLETGQEDNEASSDVEEEEVVERVDEEAFETVEEASREQVRRVWEKTSLTPLSATRKLLLVSHFMFTNAWQIKGTIFLNIVQPLMYVLIGMVVISRVDSAEDELVVPSPIQINPTLGASSASQFFGLRELNESSIDPLVPVDEPTSVQDYFADENFPVFAGYWAGNRTLQYNESISPFALQVAVQVLGNYTALLNGAGDGLATNLIQLPYTTNPFRTDLLLLPMILAFGFSGLAFCVLDVLLLKSDNIVGLFRVTGVTEWSTYQGVMLYKLATTFVPFFLLVIILGIALGSVLLGNAGRWLGTILIMLGYGYSTAPLGLLIAKRFIKKDYKSAANVFPGVYLTFVSMPYLAWNIALQVAPDARTTLLIVGDILCLIPPVAFQRGIGAIIEVSTTADDQNLTWSQVYSWENRVWFALLMMFFVGTIEWAYLYRLTTERPATTPLSDDEKSATSPTDSNSNFGVAQETARSLVDDSGINARELVKNFRIPAPRNDKKKKHPVLKTAVKGVSFGVKRNEILCMLGPNGAGKSVTMGILSGEHTADNGTVALANELLTSEHRGVNHLFQNGHVAACPQFDALFPKKTVKEHLHFYAKVRGLDMEAESTTEHLDAIVQLLGLKNHMDKLSTDISGGYKRRTCLAISLIGFPEIILIDECTTGLDPGARRLVWQLLKPPERGHGVDLPAILMSTHYMEEASAIADRITIFIDGQIVATGSLSELQHEYCNSYFVEVALLPSATDKDEAETQALFATKSMQATVYESLPYHFKLQVPFRSEQGRLDQLASIFELLETNRERLQINFYSVAQMSLEQIFIDLSRRQFEAEESTRVL